MAIATVEYARAAIILIVYWSLQGLRSTWWVGMPNGVSILQPRIERLLIKLMTAPSSDDIKP